MGNRSRKSGVPVKHFTPHERSVRRSAGQTPNRPGLNFRDQNLSNLAERAERISLNKGELLSRETASTSTIRDDPQLPASVLNVRVRVNELPSSNLRYQRYSQNIRLELCNLPRNLFRREIRSPVDGCESSDFEHGQEKGSVEAVRILRQRANHDTSLDLFLINFDPWSHGCQCLLRSVFTFLHFRHGISFYLVKIRDDVHRIRDRINNIVRTPALRNNLHRNPRSILMVTFQNHLRKLLRPIIRDLSLLFSSHRSLSSFFSPVFLP